MAFAAGQPGWQKLRRLNGLQQQQMLLLHRNVVYGSQWHAVRFASVCIYETRKLRSDLLCDSKAFRRVTQGCRIRTGASWQQCNVQMQHRLGLASQQLKFLTKFAIL